MTTVSSPFFNFEHLDADISTTSATLVSAENLAFSVEANRDYHFQGDLLYSSAATGTGIAIATNGPASPVKVVLATQIYTGITSPPVVPPVLSASVNTYNTAVASDGVGAANSLYICRIVGHVSNGPNAGTLQVLYASGRAGTAVTLSEGSHLMHHVC